MTATFVPQPTLTVMADGTGDGSISDMISGGVAIQCDSVAGSTSGDCSKAAPTGTPFQLVASPASGSILEEWSGCESISGTNGEVCSITLHTDSTVTATFITAVDAIQVLRDSVSRITHLSVQLRDDLIEPLNDAEQLLTDSNLNNDGAACNKLASFINEVNGLEGDGSLTAAEAESLRNLSERIRTSLDC